MFASTLDIEHLHSVHENETEESRKCSNERGKRAENSQHCFSVLRIL